MFLTHFSVSNSRTQLLREAGTSVKPNKKKKQLCYVYAAPASARIAPKWRQAWLSVRDVHDFKSAGCDEERRREPKQRVASGGGGGRKKKKNSSVSAELRLRCEACRDEAHLAWSPSVEGSRFLAVKLFSLESQLSPRAKNFENHSANEESSRFPFPPPPLDSSSHQTFRLCFDKGSCSLITI